MSETTIVEVGGSTSVVSTGVQGPAGAEGPQGPEGPIGPQGEPGENIIGGYSVVLSSLANNDMLKFNLSAGEWQNVQLVELTDGGNF